MPFKLKETDQTVKINPDTGTFFNTDTNEEYNTGIILPEITIKPSSTPKYKLSNSGQIVSLDEYNNDILPLIKDQEKRNDNIQRLHYYEALDKQSVPTNYSKMSDKYIDKLANSRPTYAYNAALASGAIAAGTVGAGALAEALPILTSPLYKIGPEAYKNFLLSSIGGEVTNEAVKQNTGRTIGQNIEHETHGDIPEIVGDFFNPGYLISMPAEGSSQVINRLNKWKNRKNLFANSSLKFKDKASQENFKLNELKDKAHYLTPLIYKKIHGEPKYITPSKVSPENRYKFVKKDIERRASSRFNFDKALNVQKILETFPNLNIQSSSEIGVFGNRGGFTSGDFELPIFGTDKTIKGSIKASNPKSIHKESVNLVDYVFDPNYRETIRPRLNLNKPYSQLFYTVPEEYLKGLQSNIEYLQSRFPGTKPFGSASAAVDAKTPHFTHDIDLIVTDKNFNSFGLKNARETIPGSTWTAQLDNGKYGDAGSIDFNIIHTDPKTGYATGERAAELFRQVFPDEYRRTNGVINKTPEELIDAYNPAIKSIMDSFSSAKVKHGIRALGHLQVSDPKIVAQTLEKYQNTLLPNHQILPISIEQLSNPEENLKLLESTGLKGLDLQLISKDPQKTKNALDYWYMTTSIKMRGSDPNTLRNNKSLIDSFTEWDSSSVGGSTMGAGLNSVNLGNSGYGPATAFIQPVIKFDSKVAQDIINEAKYKLGSHIQYNESQINAIKEIFPQFNGTTPQELLKQIPINEDGKQILQQLQDKLDIRGLQGGKFHRSTYNSFTGKINPETDNLWYQIKPQEIPMSRIGREDNIIINNTSGMPDFMLFDNNISYQMGRHKFPGIFMNREKLAIDRANRVIDRNTKLISKYYRSFKYPLPNLHNSIHLKFKSPTVGITSNQTD